MSKRGARSVRRPLHDGIRLDDETVMQEVIPLRMLGAVILGNLRALTEKSLLHR